MGVATPLTGQIAFSDLNSGILQQGTTTQLNMNTAGARLGYGSTSQVSISNLRGCFGLTVSSFTFQPANKYSPAYYYAAPGVTFSPSGDTIQTIIQITLSDPDYDGFGFNNTPPAAGASYYGTNVTRVASDNTLRSVTSSGDPLYPPTSSTFYANPGVVNSTAGHTFGWKFG